MSERHFLKHLHDRRAGIALASGNITSTTTFLRPDHLFTGRVIETTGGGCEIPCLPRERGLEHDPSLGAARRL